MYISVDETCQCNTRHDIAIQRNLFSPSLAYNKYTYTHTDAWLNTKTGACFQEITVVVILVLH